MASAGNTAISARVKATLPLTFPTQFLLSTLISLDLFWLEGLSGLGFLPGNIGSEFGADLDFDSGFGVSFVVLVSALS